MPRLKRKGNQLTLNLDGEKIPAAQFRRAVNAFLDMIEDVAREVSGGTDTVRWIVSVESGSDRIIANPEAIKPKAPLREITRAIRSGVTAIQRRAIRPRFFTSSALRNLKEIAASADGRELRTAGVQIAKRIMPISRQTATNVDSVLATTVADIGSVEGQLRMLSIQGAPHFNVYDDLTDRQIECFATEALLQDAHRYFGKRVAVTGVIRYRRDGEPVSIQVEDIRPFLDEDSLPSADEVYGILSKTE